MLNAVSFEAVGCPHHWYRDLPNRGDLCEQRCSLEASGPGDNRAVVVLGIMAPVGFR
jgi:hypothetical protein